MNHFYIAYLRVSTTRQAATGVSLSEQRLAIYHYAQTHDLKIGRCHRCGGRCFREERIRDAVENRQVFEVVAGDEKDLQTASRISRFESSLAIDPSVYQWGKKRFG